MLPWVKFFVIVSYFIIVGLAMTAIVIPRLEFSVIPRLEFSVIPRLDWGIYIKTVSSNLQSSRDGG